MISKLWLIIQSNALHMCDLCTAYIIRCIYYILYNYIIINYTMYIKSATVQMIKMIQLKKIYDSYLLNFEIILILDDFDFI